MSKEVVRDAQDGFIGGLNTAGDESAVASNEARQLGNMLLNEYGAAIKRGGARRLNATALGSLAGEPILGGFNFRLAGSNENLVVCNGKLFTFPYAMPATMTEETGTLSTEYPDFAQFQDGTDEVVYISDGGKLNKWNGAALTTDISATPTEIRRLAVYNQRLFGISGEDQSLYWSELNEGDTLGDVPNGGGVAIIRTFGDQRLTALATVRDSLLLFHVSGISRFTGWTQDDINIAAGTSGVTGDTGTIAPRAVIGLETEVLFLTERGFYTTNGVDVAPISGKIENLVSGLTQTQLANSFAVHFRSRREVWFYVGGLGFMVFNYRIRTWSGPLNAGYTEPASTSAWEALDGNGIPVVLVGADDGFVKQPQYANTYLDNVLSDGTGGTSFEGTLQLRRMFCAEFESDKVWRFGYLLLDPRNATNITVEWSTSYGSSSWTIALSGFEWGTGTWGSGTWGGSGIDMFRIPLAGRGTYVDFTIRDSSSAAALYSRYSIDAFRMSRRG